MIRAVIFDFFGVLVTEGFKQFQTDYFENDDEKRQKAVDLITQVDSGKISMNDFTAELAKLADISPREVADALGGNRPNKLLLDYIRQNLHGSYKTSILSNSSMDFPGKILSSKDLGLFDDVVLSYRYGIVKPQPEIYRLAARRLGVEPAQAVFIDDSPGHVEGARKVGMKSIYYDDFRQMKNELEKLLSISDK